MAVAAEAVEALRMNVLGRLVTMCRQPDGLVLRLVRLVGQRGDQRRATRVPRAALAAHWSAVRHLLLEHGVLRRFDAVEEELRRLVATQLGDLADGASICEVYNYAKAFDLWDESMADTWLQALRFRGEILQNEHCRPTEAALAAQDERLRVMLRDLSERTRACPDPGKRPTVGDVQARLKSA